MNRNRIEVNLSYMSVQCQNGLMVRHDVHEGRKLEPRSLEGFREVRLRGTSFAVALDRTSRSFAHAPFAML